MYLYGFQCPSFCILCTSMATVDNEMHSYFISCRDHRLWKVPTEPTHFNINDGKLHSLPHSFHPSFEDIHRHGAYFARIRELFDQQRAQTVAARPIRIGPTAPVLPAQG